MAIKSKLYSYISIIIILLAGMMVFLLPSITPKSIPGEKPQSSAVTIIDKVYTFLAPEDTLNFENMILKEQYNTFIEIEDINKLLK